MLLRNIMLTVSTGTWATCNSQFYGYFCEIRHDATKSIKNQKIMALNRNVFNWCIKFRNDCVKYGPFNAS